MHGEDAQRAHGGDDLAMRPVASEQRNYDRHEVEQCISLELEREGLAHLGHLLRREAVARGAVEGELNERGDDVADLRGVREDAAPPRRRKRGTSLAHTEALPNGRREGGHPDQAEHCAVLGGDHRVTRVTRVRGWPAPRLEPRLSHPERMALPCAADGNGVALRRAPALERVQAMAELDLALELRAAAVDCARQVEEREDGAGGERERDRRVRRPAPHLERRGPGQRRGGSQSGAVRVGRAGRREQHLVELRAKALGEGRLVRRQPAAFARHDHREQLAHLAQVHLGHPERSIIAVARAQAGIGMLLQRCDGLSRQRRRGQRALRGLLLEEGAHEPVQLLLRASRRLHD